MRLSLLLLAAIVLRAQTPTPSPEEVARKQLEYTRAHYTKYDYRIPMRDGVKLFTVGLRPQRSQSKKYPILMQRTPYSVAPYGIDNYRHAARAVRCCSTEEGFIFVYQDVRGRYLSEGTFIDVRRT